MEEKSGEGFHKQKPPLPLEVQVFQIFRNLKDIQGYYFFILALFL